MYLYHLTLQAPTYIPNCVAGSFTGERQQELVLIKGTSWLQLIQLDPSTGRMTSLGQQNLFCTLRSLAAFRLPGDTRDLLILGTDSGRLVVLEWRASTWQQVFRETFGRSGVRRCTPGEYLASDPRGRAIMIAAIEKQKIVYVINRDPTSAKLAISSPLESSQNNVIVFGLAAMDTGYENPIFASLEVDTTAYHRQEEEIDDGSRLPRQLVYYEAELGLNHLSRKHAEAVEQDANMLVAVPGGDEGPGGVLLFSPGHVSWHRPDQTISIKIDLPRRRDNVCQVPKRTPIVIDAAVVRAKGGFFFLCQTEEGDLLRISLQTNDGAKDEHHVDGAQRLLSIHVNYFDTVPVATNIQIFRSGFLFLASEWQSQRLYQIQSLGDDRPQGGPTFVPRELVNLALVDQMENYAEITDGRVLNLGGEETPQIYALQGRAHQSSLLVMRKGLHVTEVASTELPERPTGVWTLKKNIKDREDSFIVVAFSASTVVLQVGETVEEAADTGLVNHSCTLFCAQLWDGSIVQVTPRIVHQIRPDGTINEWRAPAIISVASINSRQVAIALQNHSLVYFETDATGILLEHRRIEDLPESITCLALGPVPEGRLRSKFLAVGSGDLTVRILSCDPEDCLEPLSLQALAAQANSLLITDSAALTSGLSLEVGLENGVLARLRLDATTGAVTDARTRYLGSNPVLLSRAACEGVPGAILAMSSRPWFGYETSSGQSHLTPLAQAPLHAASPFSSSQCPTGIVGLSGNNLNIIMVESIEDQFTKERIPLENTPRKMAHHPTTSAFAVIESDHRGLDPLERQMLVDESVEESAKDWTFTSYLGRWSSCVRLISGAHSDSFRFTENETPTRYPAILYTFFPLIHIIVVCVSSPFTIVWERLIWLLGWPKTCMFSGGRASLRRSFCSASMREN